MDDLETQLEQLRTSDPVTLKPARAMQLARSIRAEGEAAGLRRLRVAVLASYSIEFIGARLVVEGARRGFLFDLCFGPFGQFEQVVGDPESELHRFEPEALIVAMRLEDLDPDAAVRFYDSVGQRFSDLAAETVDRLGDLVDAFRERHVAPVLVANLAPPEVLPLGVFDANVEDSITFQIARANERLCRTLAERSDAFVWDYAGLVREWGVARWSDRRMMAMARTPVAGAAQPAMARHLARSLAATQKPPAKVLVLDLDNTLWGGVIGDDGVEGILLGDDHPGVAFKNFQRAVLALRDRGTLLAVASKNELEPVEKAFREHPEMLVRWEDLAATRISWGPKSVAIREIAEELNLGADSIVFFDDNPVERAEVRLGAPEVRVVEVPTDPLDYVDALANCEHFDAVALTQEDRGRADLYQQEGERKRLASRSGTLEDFLVGLEMRATVGLVDASSMQRVAQLIGKTNQFNLTTRRHSAADLEAMVADPNHVVAFLRLRDRYGDAGLVVVGILRRDGTDAHVDTFLMSCRVMGRQVEHAFMAYLAEQASRLGCRRLIGEYLPTAKNAMVESFYPELGFDAGAAREDGGRSFSIDLEADALVWPSLIARDPTRDEPSDPAAPPA